MSDDRLPTLEDNLPLVEAFVLETLRYTNVAPLAFPHYVAGGVALFFKVTKSQRNVASCLIWAQFCLIP